MTTYVITGASDGIGAELARQIAARERGGATLVLAARNRERLADVAAQCDAQGATAMAVPPTSRAKPTAARWSRTRPPASAASTCW
jgi:short-subunit dehydrogenase